MAWDRHLECMVAVKEEKIHLNGGSSLKKEMEALKKLKHPMLPAVLDFFCTEKQYLALEYIEGVSLHNYITKEGAIPEKQACKWALQLLDLLSYLHGQKPAVIYRDLKPANIMVCPDSALRVVDFGAASCMNFSGEIQSDMAGTPGYAAPEQLGGNAAGRFLTDVDERSDIYNFGATLYHMLTGLDPSLPPYGVRPPRCIKPELSSGIDKIVSKCTRDEPSKRYQSAEEIKKDLLNRYRMGKRRYFAGFGKRRKYVIKRLEKNIYLTEKKTMGPM